MPQRLMGLGGTIATEHEINLPKQILFALFSKQFGVIKRNSLFSALFLTRSSFGTF